MNGTNTNSQVGVVEPMGPAYQRMKQQLFQPFDLARWLALGVCAWLAMLGDATGMGGGGWGGGGKNRGGPGPSFDELWTDAKTYVLENLTWLVPVVLGGLLVIAAISVLVLWLSSRGRFMLLDNVVTGRAEVAVPWRGFALLGNSLFRFRLLLAVAAFLLAFPPAGVGAFAIIGMVRREEVDTLSLLVAVGGIGLSMVVSLAFLVIEVLTTDFVVPVMWQHGAAWRAAWAEVFGLVLQNSLRIGVYLLFRLLMSVVIGLGIVAVVLLTCCVAGCLLALPYVGTVVLLPVLLFQRAYSLYYLSQYGPRFDVFRPRPAAV